MSIWTHVCGCIRVDAMRSSKIDDVREIENITEKLGKIVLPLSKDKNTTLPCGSEGSIEYRIISNEDLSNIAAYNIPIWGDLRDYDSVDEIEKWFRDVCSKLDVRDAVIEIVVYGETETKYVVTI